MAEAPAKRENMQGYLIKTPGWLVLGIALAMGMGNSASADIINIVADTNNSTEGLGDFSGTLQYDYQMGDMGLLTLIINNTSDEANGGWITGIIFNFASSDENATADLADATYPFDNAPGQSGVPFGDPYMGGAALGGEWLDGGDPRLGIGVDESGTFIFDITATDAGLLTAGSFLQGPYDFNFLVRFRGFENGGSDKVPALPAPGAIALLGLGALAHRRRKR